MSKPLALVYYANLMPGSQLPGRLQDLGYRVQSASDPALLAQACESDMPLVVIAELTPADAVCGGIARMRANPTTQHIPVLGFVQTHDAAAQSQAREAGVTLLAAGAGIAEQLPQLLNQILQVE